jgi:preprotein translocase subunit SecB
MSIIIKVVYTKRMNYESQNTPRVFFEKSTFNQNLELNFSINQLDKENYEIIMQSVVRTSNEKDETVSQIFVEKAGVFEVKDIPEEDLQEVLNVNLPSILFPYLRQEVENIVHYSGLPPFHIQPISFYDIYQNKKSKG